MGQSISNEWEKIHSRRGWGKYPGEPVIRFVAKNFYELDRKNVRLLDFGCGQGANTWYLAREGFDVYAFDGAPSAVEKTKAMLNAEGLPANISKMDAAEITYEDDFFDGVIDAACVGHNRINEITNMYKDIYRILKPGGRLYTSFFTTNTTGFGTGELIENNTYKNATKGPMKGLGVAHYWEAEEFREVLVAVGFKNIELERSSYTNQGDLIEMYILTAQKWMEA